MPYKMIPEGIQELSQMLARLENQAQPVASKGLYKGAGIMADEVQSQAESITTEPFHYAVFVQRSASPEEKAVVQNGVGIAKFQKNGSDVQTSVGYGNAGYAMMAGKRKPIPKIANAINSGTSFMKKQPFFRRAVNSGSAKASEAIRDSIEKDFDAITT